MKRALFVAVLAAVLVAPLARADGDPASDFLLSSQIFYFYTAPKPGLERLQKTVAAANALGYRIRVAVITSPYDLGSLSALWEKPEAYCRFLSLELSFVYKGRLLVVSPHGYGYVEKTKPVPAALAALRPLQIRKDRAGLLQTADTAVRTLARREGYKLPAVHASASSSNSDTVVIAIAAALGTLLVILVGLLRRRRRQPTSEATP